MVNQFTSLFGFENLKIDEIKSTLDSIISKHPYFHLAQLYRLQLYKQTSSNQKYLSQVAVNTYQRRLLKHSLEQSSTEEKPPTTSIKKESVPSKTIDELTPIPNSAKVIRPHPISSVYGKDDLSKNRLVQTNEVYTETLAELYLKQYQYQKAIEVLSFLKSTDSKKSDYFARRIKEVQKQQKESKPNS